jgi:hypothetical protein
MDSKKIETLIENGIIKDAFNDYEFIDDEIKETYRYFEEKFQSLFKEYAEFFGLKNCYFYMKNGFNCNASASKINGINLISITNGYPILMNRKFNEKYFAQIIVIGLSNDKSISDAYADLHEDSDFKYQQFMLDCSIQYTFSHEFRHIQQFNSSDISADITLNENLDRTKFKMKKHVWEFDADRMASFEVLKYIFRTYRSLNNRNDEKLKCLLFTGLASIIITKILFYFGIMNQLSEDFKIKKQEFYTEKFSHPHPLIRVINIYDYFYNNIQDSFPKLNIGQQEVINNSLGLVNIYLKSLIPNQNLMKDYFDDLGKYLEEINKYNAKLYDFAIKDESIKELLFSRNIKLN